MNDIQIVLTKIAENLEDQYFINRTINNNQDHFEDLEEINRLCDQALTIYENLEIEINKQLI